MSFTAADVLDMLNMAGESVTLRRLGTPNVDVTCRAKIDAYQPEQLPAGGVQGDRRVIISNVEIAVASWPGPPRKGDRIIPADGKPMTVQGVDTTTIGSETVMHRMQARG